MRYTKIFWKDSILVESAASAILINPYFDYSGSQSYLLGREPNSILVVLTFSMPESSRIIWENWCQENHIPCFLLLEDGAVAEIQDLYCIYHHVVDQASYLVLSCQGKYMLYDDGVQHPESVEKLVYDLVMFKLHGIEQSLALAQQLKPKTGVPLSSSDEQAIEFCRQLMLNHYAVPKYLKHGQYVIL